MSAVLITIVVEHNRFLIIMFNKFIKKIRTFNWSVTNNSLKKPVGKNCLGICTVYVKITVNNNNTYYVGAISKEYKKMF